MNLTQLSAEEIESFHNAVSFFQQTKRSFPWRERKTAYRVWVAEVMLQQTRADVVVPYFLRWFERFPTIHSLSLAPLEEVIKAWEGLGYYRRARNLHLGAKYIVESLDGIMPSTKELLLTIPGIGPYTAAAIAAFAFERAEIAFDCNVTRVLSRFFLERAVEKPVLREQITSLIRSSIREKLIPILAEALIEIGACFCRRGRPLCTECPLSHSCQAYQKELTEEFPPQKAKKQTVRINRRVFLLECNRSFLLMRREDEKLMSHLYQFPFLSQQTEEEELLPLLASIEEQFGIASHFIERIERLPQVKQSFTIYEATLFPYRIRLSPRSLLPKKDGYEWVEEERIQEKPLCSGHRKIAQQLLNSSITRG